MDDKAITELSYVKSLLALQDEGHQKQIESLRRDFKSAIDALGLLINTKFEAQKDAVNAAMTAADKAVIKAEGAAEKRFESVNEFRATLTDQQRTFIPRQEAESTFRSLSERIETLSKSVDRLVTERAGVKGGWGYAVGVIGLVLALLAIASFVLKFK